MMSGWRSISEPVVTKGGFGLSVRAGRALDTDGAVRAWLGGEVNVNHKALQHNYTR